MKDNTNLARRALAAALVLGVIGDLLLRPAPIGINVSLWLALLVAATLLLGLSGEVGWPPRTIWLAVPVLVFALAFGWRDSPGLRSLNLLAFAAAATMWSLSVAAGRIGAWTVLDYIRELLTGGTAMAVGAFVLGRRDFTTGHATLRLARSTAIGLLIAVPLLFVFGGLLMAADAVFDQLLSEALDFDFAKLGSHAALTTFFAWTVAGLLLLMLGIHRPSPDVRLAIQRPRLGILELAVPLTLLNALFLAFVLIQLRYLFGDASLVQETVGLTYAEYARRGFFELVTVAALVLPLLLLADWTLVDRSGPRINVFRGLAGTQLALLFVIMGSAFKRMLLYQSVYGLTEQRFYATALMVWLGVVLIWFALTVLPGRRPLFASGAVIAGLVTVGFLNVLNPDALIARVNTLRASEGKPFDSSYVTSLSGDAVPPLVAALPALAPDRRCEVIAHLLERWDVDEVIDWRTWNYGHAKAIRALRARSASLGESACGAASSQPGG